MRSVFITAMLLASGAFAQTAAGLDGVWVRGGGGGRGGPTTQWSPDPLAFTPAGKKQLEANKPGKGPRAVVPAFGNDPMGGANPPGLYRTLIYNRPFEMVQLPGRVVQLFEWDKIWRVIWTDGRPVPDDIPEGPYWYGYSVGKWEGDTMVIDTIGFNDRGWIDTEKGRPQTQALHVIERFRRLNVGTMELGITIDDPKAYTKPWTVKFNLNLVPDTELIETVCENSRNVEHMVGK